MIRDAAPLDGYHEPYGLLASILQDGTRGWREELDWEGNKEIGPEAVTWQVWPGGHSIGAIYLHMILVEVAWMEEFVLKREPSEEDKRILMWDEFDVDAGKWPVPPHESIEWYYALQDRYRARVLEAIKEWPAPDVLIEGWGKQYTPRWIFGHVIQHESYHGGQIVLVHDLYERTRQ